MTVGRTVVIGVGNPWRRDDGVGPAVARAVRAGAGPSVDVQELDGEVGRLIEAWEGASLAVVVDAVRTGAAAPGTVHQVDANADAGGAEPGPSASSHGLGVQEAIGLSRALGRAPERLVLVGVEGGDFGHGAELSPAVAAAVEQAASAVLAIIGPSALGG